MVYVIPSAQVCPEGEERMSDSMILAQGQEYSLDCNDTKLNNNVIVVGTSGAGKTSGIVIPNLIKATGSYIVTDPKGNLCTKLGPYLKVKGYSVMSIDLSNPNGSTRYNFLDYIKDEHDVIKIAHILMTAEGAEASHGHNAYFYLTGELVVASALAMFKWYDEEYPDEKDFYNFRRLFNYCRNCIDDLTYEKYTEDNGPKSEKQFLDDENGMMENKWYDLGQRLKACVGSNLSPETAGSVLSTIGSVLGKFNTAGVEEMMTSDRKRINFSEIGFKKTALFVRISDTDRSMDALANIFFTQAMDELCRVADFECRNNSLPVAVRFIMDDFATNCSIEDFPRMISTIRSRNISAMVMLQSEAQLEKRYGKDSSTIINNCDTYVYMGGNDIQTASNIAKRLDLPLKRVLYMPIGTSWIFRRGHQPVNARNILPKMDVFLQSGDKKTEKRRDEKCQHM